MADRFFDGGQLPPQFNRASGFDPGPEPKHPDDPELNYDPPYNPPGPGLGGATTTQDVAREELDGPARDSIQQAQDRMERGETEMDDPMLTPEFNTRSQDIEEVRKEDQDRGLDFDNEWDEQSQREYERYSLEAEKERYDERWGEQDAIDDYERFAASMEQSDGLDDPDTAYSEFMRDQNAEIEANHDFSPDQGPEHDRDIEH